MKAFKKLISFALLMCLVCTTFTGCMKPYDTPELVNIEASQTAFLIPLVGDSKEQASFESEKMLADAKVAAKEVQIPHRWVKTKRMYWQGEWRPSAKLIVVERKPVTREWTSDKATGSDSKNQAIYAESVESIGFSVGINCSAQIDETDAVKFLYRYNTKTLNSIMDTEIRARVESKFVEQCSKYSLNEILLNKEKIMIVVRDDVTEYFKERGVTITVLGMKDGLEYEDASIQQSINDKFSSEQKLVTQKNENERLVSEAQAKAEANRILQESISEQLLDKQWIEKWNGQLPQVVSDGNMLYGITK